MDSNLMCEKFLESFACAHINEGLFEDGKWDMMNCFMQSEGSPILKIKALKDRGNNLFKQNCFGGAGACYDEACKLLSLVVGMEGSYDTKSLSDLAVSLNLNLAACALKLFEYEASKDLCSIVLSSFPHNVKALFRRGVAFMKLKKFVDAQSDLEEALLVEPKNKDILRELCVVKNCLAINSNGKRIIDDHPVQEPTGKGKMHVQDEGLGRCFESESCIGSTSAHDSNISHFAGSLTQLPIAEKFDMELDTNKFVLDQQSCFDSGSTSTSEVPRNFDGCANATLLKNAGCNRDLNKKLEGCHGVDKGMLQFSKKGGGHSLLKIDQHTYNKLLDGKEVSFFRKSHLSTMKIRILQPINKPIDCGTKSDANSEPERGSITSYRKKRKRRKRKKCLRDGMGNDDSKSDVMSLSCADIIKPIDSDRAIEKVTSSLSCEVVNHRALCDTTSVNSHHRPAFIFTSLKSKVTKAFIARRQSTRIHSRRKESPRRNVCFYSGKFPRSRNVSVSCCRYSSEAQILKKRKELATSADYPSNSLKKPRVLSTPAPFSSLCNNKVVSAFDLESQMCTL